MRSWVGGDGLGLGSCTGLLLSDDVVGAASTQTAPSQQIVEIAKRRHGCTRRADLHALTGRGVEHPFRDDREHARHDLDAREAAHPAPVDPLDPDAPAKQRVPAIVDDRILPDMGTMDG